MEWPHRRTLFCRESVVFCRELHLRAARAAVAICVIGFSACSDSRVVEPRSISPGVLPRFAKPAVGLAVASASPAFGDQGVTIDVHVLGSGFTAGAQATWLLHGAPDAHVHTNKTTFVSSTELVANITIASDATLAFWDVQVALAGGKNGVGSELFEVTSAQILGSGTPGGDARVFGVSESGAQIAGYASGAWVYDQDAGMISLGQGQAMAVDPLGTLVGGKDGAGLPTVWIRQSAAAWIPQHVPSLLSPAGTSGRLQGAARAADGTLLLTGFDTWANNSKPSSPLHHRVALWTRDQTGQWQELEYALPAGFGGGAGIDVNPLGQIVGQPEGQTIGVIWDNPTTSVVLDGLAKSISDDGRLAVGFKFVGSDQVPMIWWRDPSTQQWHTTGIQLPSLGGASCPAGNANGVNSAGFIVGRSCIGSQKFQATVWHVDFAGPTPVLSSGPNGLSGLGKSGAEDVSNAASISETAPYWISGFAASSPSQVAVRWRLALP